MNRALAFIRRLAFTSLVLLLPCIAQAKPKALVYLPQNPGKIIPAAIWLHGYRSFPGALSDPFFQKLADDLHIAVIGVPGTTTLDDETLQWSEEPVADHAYIQEVLGLISLDKKVEFGKLALFGFSQGALVAGDLAMRWPEAYTGAILMSPGGMTQPHPPKAPLEAHKKQIYIAVCGAGEHPGNVELTKVYALLGRALGAEVIHKEYEGIKEHTRPPDFKERLPEWLAKMLGLKEVAK